MPVPLLCLPVVSTLVGGAVALRFRRYTSLLIAVGAGILLGAAFLDLLPEAIVVGLDAGLTSSDVLALTLLAFLGFYAMESGISALNHRLEERRWSRSMLRHAGASMLVFHSFRDGMAIGAAYTASHSAGYAVALGIAAHDVGDGMNAVILTSQKDTPRWTTYLFLLADAVAPFVGGLLTSWWTVSHMGSVALLALTAGFFLQMATGDFLPELQRSEISRRFLVPSVLFGAAMIYAANVLLGKVL